MGDAHAQSALEALAPTVPPCSTEILDTQQQPIKYHLPSLNQNLAAMKQSQIAKKIAKFTQ